ncbi:PREDICTED: coxsackievirus and adenovirus receptor homolog, partial [Cyprinodon variegatus]|uniref:coxsackievirus and adenovirus receptor homolog n=1 Tax=Cyprinodon variegatus TaxID=28743 RepID=UPI0007428C0D
MAAMSAVMLLRILVSVYFAFSSADKQAKPGQTVILPCKTADSQPALAVEWRRSDLESEYVLLFRDDRTDAGNQHPSYKNRTDLQDRQMKNGDVSLVLKNVTTNDTGTYECKVQNEESRRIKLIVQVDVPPSP